jgi:hypothetical protein
MDRGRAVLLALPLLTAALSGCTVADDFNRFVHRLQGQPELQQRELLNEALDFTIAEAEPGVPPAKRANYNFTVPTGSRDLRVDVSVTFDPFPPSPAPPLPVPLPGPQGQVSALVKAPDGSTRNLNFTMTGGQSVNATPPLAGAWGVHVDAFGMGRVRVIALGTVPVP